MALFRKKNGDPVAEAESKVQELRERGEALQAQRQRVSAKREAAIEDRRASLLDDDALDKAGFAIANLDAQLAGLDDAIAEVQAVIGEAETALAAANDRAQRERQAQELQAKAKSAQGAFDRYLDAADELSSVLEGTGLFEADEAIAWVRRLANDIRVGKPRILQSIDGQIKRLRAEPDPAPVQPPAPPVGEISPYRRQFAASGPGAIGDRAPDRQYFGGFAETEH
jgi:DNA repair exonuclease SbcCD ATPase subunit